MGRDRVKDVEGLIEVILRMIPKEREAHEVYRRTARAAPSEMTRLLFEQLAEQEGIHERKLKAALELLRCEQLEQS
jgi:rubrerythrin